jgi:hypothetical protein
MQIDSAGGASQLHVAASCRVLSLTGLEGADGFARSPRGVLA